MPYFAIAAVTAPQQVVPGGLNREANWLFDSAIRTWYLLKFHVFYPRILARSQVFITVRCREVGKLPAAANSEDAATGTDR